MKKLLLILPLFPLLNLAQQPINDGYLDEFFISSIDSVTQQSIYTMYKVDRRGIFGSSKEMRKKVIRKANEFAAKHRKKLEEVSYHAHPMGILADWATFTYVFKLVPINKKEAEIKKTDDKYDKLEKLGKLRDDGILTEEEFQKEKKKILNEE